MRKLARPIEVAVRALLQRVAALAETLLVGAAVALGHEV
jgi:hypothetical protein